MRDITFEQVAALLPKPRNAIDEAFEVRWLHDNGGIHEDIYVEAHIKDQMVRVTFPMFGGRGRVWLKRAEYNELTQDDLIVFLGILDGIQRQLKLPMRFGKHAEKVLGLE